MISYLITSLRTAEIEAMLEVIPKTAIKAIVSGHVVPEALQSLNQFLQIYRVSPVLPKDVQRVTWRICCRQRTEANADKLAELVYANLNRVFGSIDSKRVFSICRIIESIPEEQNLFNTVVEAELTYV